MAEINPEVEYIRKDVFDARMDRMEALQEKTLMEMKADNEKLRSEVNAAVSRMETGNEKLRSEVNAAVNRMETGNEKLRSEVKEEIGGLRMEIRVVNERIDSVNDRLEIVQTTVYWGFAILTVVFGLATLSPAISDFFRNLRKPSVTLEDVQRLIDAAIERALKPSPHQ